MENKKTQYYTDFVSKDRVINDIRKCSEEFVFSFSNDLINTGEMLSISIADNAGYINHIAKMHEWPEYIRKLYLQCFFISEHSVKGSGNIAAYFFATKMLDHDLAKIETTTIKRSTKKIAFASLSKFIDVSDFNFVKETISHLGIKGKLSIRKTHSSQPALELNSCHRFNIGLLDTFKSEAESRDEVKILLYDGVIENISQIDRLLNECHDQKTSCVIVARSYSDDVISTLNVNYIRKTLDVLPISINDEIQNINVIGDIATCSASTMITAETGIRLNNISIGDLASIKNVKITKSNLSFDKNDKSKKRLEKRCKEINKRIEKAFWDDKMSKEDIELVYGNRLDSLSANSVTLWVNRENDYISYLNNVFSFSISFIAAFANSGVVKINCPIMKKAYTFPANIVNTSLLVSKSMHSAICNSGGCVAIQ